MYLDFATKERQQNFLNFLGLNHNPRDIKWNEVYEDIKRCYYNDNFDINEEKNGGYEIKYCLVELAKDTIIKIINDCIMYTYVSLDDVAKLQEYKRLFSEMEGKYKHITDNMFMHISGFYYKPNEIVFINTMEVAHGHDFSSYDEDKRYLGDIELYHGYKINYVERDKSYNLHYCDCFVPKAYWDDRNFNIIEVFYCLKIFKNFNDKLKELQKDADNVKKKIDNFKIPEIVTDTLAPYMVINKLQGE